MKEKMIEVKIYPFTLKTKGEHYDSVCIDPAQLLKLGYVKLEYVNETNEDIIRATCASCGHQGLFIVGKVEDPISKDWSKPDEDKTWENL